MLAETLLTLIGQHLAGKGVDQLFDRLTKGSGEPPQRWIAEVVERGEDRAIEEALACLSRSGIPECELDKEVHIRAWIESTARAMAAWREGGQPPGCRDYLAVAWTIEGGKAVVGSCLWGTFYSAAGVLFVSALGCDRSAGATVAHPMASLDALYARVTDDFLPPGGSEFRALVFETEFPSAVAGQDRKRSAEAAMRLRNYQNRLARLGIVGARLPVDYRQPCLDPGGGAEDAVPLMLCAASRAWPKNGRLEIPRSQVRAIVEFVYDELYRDAFAEVNDQVSSESLARYRNQLAELKARALRDLPAGPGVVDDLMMVEAARLGGADGSGL